MCALKLGLVGSVGVQGRGGHRSTHRVMGACDAGLQCLYWAVRWESAPCFWIFLVLATFQGTSEKENKV